MESEESLRNALSILEKDYGLCRISEQLARLCAELARESKIFGKEYSMFEVAFLDVAKITDGF